MIDQTSNLDREQRELDAEMARLKARQTEITNEKHRRLDIEHQAAAVMAKTADEKQKQLTAEHDALVDKCRNAKQEVDNLFAAKQSAESSIHAAKRRVADASAELRIHRAVRPNPDDYPTATQVEQWQAENERLADIVAKAEQESSEAWTAYEVARVKHMAAKEAFDQLADRERELRAELTPPARPTTNGIFGMRAAGLA